MAWHWVEDKLLSDDEFKQHREREGLAAIGSLLLPAIGWAAVCAGIGWLFPVWTEANPWFVFPVLLLAFFRAGLFELFGALTIIVFFAITMIEFF